MVLQWHHGRVVGSDLVWDATCPNTFVPSYLASATSHAGAVAAAAEEWKKIKYISLSQCHSFVPVAIEMTSVS